MFFHSMVMLALSSPLCREMMFGSRSPFPVFPKLQPKIDNLHTRHKNCHFSNDSERYALQFEYGIHNRIKRIHHLCVSLRSNSNCWRCMRKPSQSDDPSCRTTEWYCRTGISLLHTVVRRSTNVVRRISTVVMCLVTATVVPAT